jgi:hypothetical protein
MLIADAEQFLTLYGNVSADLEICTHTIWYVNCVYII